MERFFVTTTSFHEMLTAPHVNHPHFLLKNFKHLLSALRHPVISTCNSNLKQTLVECKGRPNKSGSFVSQRKRRVAIVIEGVPTKLSQYYLENVKSRKVFCIMI